VHVGVLVVVVPRPLVGEGAAAAIVASEEAIVRLGIDRTRCVRVLSSAQRSEMVYAESSNFDAELTRQTTVQALDEAGITTRDLDVVELHDAFSVEEIFYLEAMGIAKPGEAPAMLRDILEHVLSGEPDMELIAAPPPCVKTVPDRQPAPDVVIVGVGEPALRARTLLERWPASHVFVVTAGGHRMLMYELLPREVDLGEVSPAQVVEAIRSAVEVEHWPRTS